MKFESLDRLEVSIWRLMGLGVAASSASAAILSVVLGDSLGGAKMPTLFVISVLVFYIVATGPRRVLDRQRVAQARESLPLGAAAAACLHVTGSRSRTLILLRSREPALAAVENECARRVLLGERPVTALEASSRELASYSASLVLQNVSTMGPGDFAGGDEEVRGITSYTELSKETKLPLFMTVCFFAPIMLVLFSVFTHSENPGALAELAAFEFVVLDLTFYFSTTEGEPK